MNHLIHDTPNYNHHPSNSVYSVLGTLPNLTKPNQCWTRKIYSCEIIKENNYIDVLIDRFAYVKAKTKERMENIRGVIKEYIEERLK